MQASWEREVAKQEARIQAQLGGGAGDAAQQLRGQHAEPTEEPALTLAQQLAQAPGAQQPAWGATPDDDDTLASLLAKVAGAFQQASLGGGAQLDMPGAGTEGPAGPAKTPRPQAAQLLSIEQSIERAVAALQLKLDDLSERLARMTLDDPKCNDVLRLMQTCAITLNLLASSRLSASA